ncbi:MAG: ATP-binding protein [Thermoanaerobaculia bacterium]
MTARRTRLGLPQEASILFAVGLVLLVFLSTFTVVAYRAGLDELADSGVPATGEMARQRSLAHALTWVVVPVDVAVALLVLLYLRHLVTPYEALVAQARRASPQETHKGDLELLLATFERALVGLSDELPADADIETLRRSLLGNLDSGVLLVDSRRRVVSVNAAGARLLGVMPPSGDERPELAAMLPGLEALQHLVDEALGSGGPSRRADLEIETAEGGAILGATAHPLVRDDGTVRGVLVLVVDLTAAKREAARERLSRSLAELGELSAGLAHELRNGLATLRGYLGLLERDTGAEERREYVEEIRRESEHLQRVLDDFLAFSRPEERRLEAVDLEALTRRAARDPGLGGLTVEVRCPDPVLPVDGDPHLLERALRNLLRNAAAAQEESGAATPLEVRVRSVPAGVEVAVLDRGCGLPEGPVARLFQPFVSHRQGGVGLGLALAQRLAALHGGSIRLEGRTGGGARATLTLPIHWHDRGET